MLDIFNSTHQYSLSSNSISIFLCSRRYCIFWTLNKYILLLLLLSWNLKVHSPGTKNPASSCKYQTEARAKFVAT